MSKKRVSLSEQLFAEIHFRSSGKCCVCRREGRQVHHLDGDPANNAFDNLAFLCFECHWLATIEGGQARRLTAPTIRRHRDDLYAATDRMRTATKEPRAPSGHTALMEALACHEIRKLRRVSLAATQGRQWDAALNALREVGPFVDDGGAEVRQEAVYVSYLISGFTRHGTPHNVVSEVADIAGKCAHWAICSLANPNEGTTHQRDEQLIRQAAAVGFGLAHDGGKYRRDLRIVEAGADVLWSIVRLARMRDLESPVTVGLQEFEHAKHSATEHSDGPFEEAIRWLEFRKLDALAIGDDPVPPMPRELAGMIWNRK